MKKSEIEFLTELIGQLKESGFEDTYPSSLVKDRISELTNDSNTDTCLTFVNDCVCCNSAFVTENEHMGLCEVCAQSF